MSAAPVRQLDRKRFRYKMKDLCRESGLERQAIHFYIHEGLLPPGEKTGRNMAWYREEHLERLHLIKRLQHERFLPLKAIKAILDGREDAFPPDQQQFLQGLKGSLGPFLVPESGREVSVDAAQAAEAVGAELEDLERAVEIGLMGGSRDADGKLRVSAQDSWLIELFAEARRIGLTRELGFGADDIAFFDELMTSIFKREVELLSERLSHLPLEEAAQLIERTIPLVHRFLTQAHAQKVRDFFSNLL